MINVELAICMFVLAGLIVAIREVLHEMAQQNIEAKLAEDLEAMRVKDKE